MHAHNHKLNPNPNPNPNRYRGVNGFLKCYRDTYVSGGVARFYRGIGPYLVRMAPGSAIQFAVFDGLKNFFV